MEDVDHDYELEKHYHPENFSRDQDDEPVIEDPKDDESEW